MKKKRYKMLTDKEKEKILTLHKQGVKTKYIAERFRSTPQNIRCIIRKNEGNHGNNKFCKNSQRV